MFWKMAFTYSSRAPHRILISVSQRTKRLSLPHVQSSFTILDNQAQFCLVDSEAALEPVSYAVKWMGDLTLSFLKRVTLRAVSWEE